MREFDLYPPMCEWLENYLKSKYKRSEIIVVDAHSERLDRVLSRYGIVYDVATGIDIQIDVLGIVKNLRDLGQLWAYCKLVDPEEAFLLTSADLGSLNKLLNVYHREDLLDFGDGKKIKKMKVGIWNMDTNAPDMQSLIPKL